MMASITTSCLVSVLLLGLGLASPQLKLKSASPQLKLETEIKPEEAAVAAAATEAPLSPAQEEAELAVQDTVQHLGTLEGTVGFLFGEFAQNLLFNDNSPFTYAVNYDYTPLITSVVTILNFVASENSPGYILATYDYQQLIRRITPEFIQQLARLPEGSGVLKRFFSALLLYNLVFIELVSIGVFFYFIGYSLAAIVDVNTQRQQQRSSRGLDVEGAGAGLLDTVAGGVLGAVEGLRLLQTINSNNTGDNVEMAVGWLRALNTRHAAY